MEAIIVCPRPFKRAAAFIAFLLAAIAVTWQHLPAQELAGVANLAFIYLMEERYGDAAPLLEKAVAQKGSVSFFYNNLGMAYEGIGKLERAGGAFRRALEIDSDYTKARSNLVRVQTLLGKTIELEEPVEARGPAANIYR
jgi:Flp pilus assembly protein TadD